MTYNTAIKSVQAKGQLWQAVGGTTINLIATSLDTREAIVQLVSGGLVVALMRLRFRRVMDRAAMLLRAEQTGHVECVCGSYSVVE